MGLDQAHSGIEALLADEDVRAVYVATLNALHRKHVIAAARAGKHVLVEKPIALTVAEAEEMIAACQAAGVNLAAGYMMRFHALHRALREIIANGGLGQVIYGRTQLTCWYPPMPSAWRQDPAAGGAELGWIWARTA